jgi:hypothetical protein
MRLEAIYDKGKLEFIQPVHFLADRIRVIVEVPEEKLADFELHVEGEPESEYIHDLVARLDAIRKAKLPENGGLPTPTEKQVERFEAFALREDR